MNLTPSQRAAIDHITTYALTRKENALDEISHVLRMSNISEADYHEAVKQIKIHARVAMHFHPDRPSNDLKTVAESLLESGIYKSQFETFISNGSVSAHPGGARDLWEQQLFGGAYTFENSTNDQRPKYGSLNLMNHADGPSPRFGSCYFLLKPKVSHRSTFTYLDSYQNPDEKGTYEAFDDIMMGLLVESFVRDYAIGEKDIMPHQLITYFIENLKKSFQNPNDQSVSRNLNHYIEAQVHGEISLERDVEILVIDPSFKGTNAGNSLVALCIKYDIQLYYHPGFELNINEVPDYFRGPTMPSLGKRISQNGYVNPACIGKAAIELKQNPESWADRGTYKEVLQELKLIWHVLVKFGQPFIEK